MEEKLQQAYLYDFYGELLNEHQRLIYEDFVFNDLSLGEIAGEEGITRQGVADMIKRCGKKLPDYEKKTSSGREVLICEAGCGGNSQTGRTVSSNKR